MSNNSKFDIGQIDAFKGIDKAVINELYKNAETIVLDIGDPITIKNEISSKIYIINDGQARVLCNLKGKRSTFEKLGKGDIIGLSSLLTVSGCEDIIAASKIELIAFSDESILNLYLKDDNFKDWCNSNIQKQEIQALAEKISDNLLNSDKSIREMVLSLSNKAKLIIKNNNSTFVNDEKYFYFASSGNIENIAISDELKEETIIKIRKNLPARIIGIDKEIYKESVAETSVISNKKLITEKIILERSKKKISKVVYYQKRLLLILDNIQMRKSLI